MNIQEFVKPELLVLLPVLYFIGAGLKRSNLGDKWIPIVLGGAGVLLSLAWVISTSEVSNFQAAMTGIFAAVTQGILCAGLSVYVNQIIKQANKNMEEK